MCGTSRRNSCIISGPASCLKVAEISVGEKYNHIEVSSFESVIEHFSFVNFACVNINHIWNRLKNDAPSLAG